MSKFLPLLLVAALAAGVVAVKAALRSGEPEGTVAEGPLSPEDGRPRLLELGSVGCVACRVMEGVLEDLRVRCGDQLQIDFVDVGRSPEVGQEHGIQLIPTQILFDPEGRELHRHEGIYSTDEILQAFRERGYPLQAGGEASGGLAGLFSRLRAALDGPLALAVAALWGVLALVLSPCHLASIPLIVGYIQGQERVTPGRALAVSCLFAAGLLLTIAAVGAITASVGRLAGDLGGWSSYLVAGVLALVGLHLMDLLPIPWSAPRPSAPARRGLLGGFLLGLIFGIALGPCTFAFLAPMLAVAFAAGSSSLLAGASLLAAYGVGHCFLIVLAGTSAASVQRFLTWDARAGWSTWSKRVCGGLVLVASMVTLWLT